MATVEDLMRANKYWEEREQDVWGVAYENGLGKRLEELKKTTDFHFDSFLFDLFDYGNADLESVDILEALLEVLE